MKKKKIGTALFIFLLLLSIEIIAAEVKQQKKIDNNNGNVNQHSDVQKNKSVGSASKWNDVFLEKSDDLSSTGKNTYFILEPGFQLVLEGEEENEKVQIFITVLKQTKKIDGVETRIVEEKELVNGEIVEISKNYFAISKKTKNVYYFGEDVDMIKNGKIINHNGSWVSGKKGAKFGMMMPGAIKIGEKYYQEIAPEIAMDRSENISITEEMSTPAGKLKNCLKTQEGSTLNPKEKEFKYYAQNIGLIKDGPAKLVKYGFIDK